MNANQNLQANLASHSGKWRLDELVPSRYALRIGEIEVLVVSDGVLPLPDHDAGTQRRPGRPGGVAERHVLAAGRVRLGAERGRGAQRRANHSHRRRARGPIRTCIAAGRAVGQATGGRRHRSDLRDRRGADPYAHGSRRRAARRRGEGPTASGPADPRGGRRGRSSGKSPDFSRTAMPPGFPDALRKAAKRFVASSIAANCGRSTRSTRSRRAWSSVAPAATLPGTAWSGWRPAARRLTFAGDAVFAVGFEQPDWHNGFEHDPEEAARVRVASSARTRDDRRASGGHAPAVPVRRPGGGGRRRLSLGAGLLGLLSGCRVNSQEETRAPAEGARGQPIAITDAPGLRRPPRPRLRTAFERAK